MGSILLGTLLIILSVALLVRHGLLWKRRRDDQSPAAVRDYHRRQFVRRSQASGLMLALGGLLLAESLITDPYWRIAYWAFAGLIVCWLVVLALADISSTQAHFQRLGSEFAAGRAALEKEIARLRQESSQSNGHKGKNDPRQE